MTTRTRVATRLSRMLARAMSVAMGSLSLAMTRACGKGARGGDGQHAGAAAEIEHARKAPAPRQYVDRLEAAGRGGVVAGAEGFAGFDLDGQRSHADARAVVAAVHDEAAGENRRESCLRDGNPVGVGYGFDDGAADARAEVESARSISTVEGACS